MSFSKIARARAQTFWTTKRRGQELVRKRFLNKTFFSLLRREERSEASLPSVEQVEPSSPSFFGACLWLVGEDGAQE
jgi:hypothetical protein